MGIETRAAMDEFEEPSFCKDAVRNRWDLQVTRFGIRLSGCLGVTRDYLNLFNDILNGLHDESRVYKVIIPNAGINVLSQIPVSPNHPLSETSAKLPCLDFRRTR